MVSQPKENQPNERLEHRATAIADRHWEPTRSAALLFDQPFTIAPTHHRLSWLRINDYSVRDCDNPKSTPLNFARDPHLLIANSCGVWLGSLMRQHCGAKLLVALQRVYGAARSPSRRDSPGVVCYGSFERRGPRSIAIARGDRLSSKPQRCDTFTRVPAVMLEWTTISCPCDEGKSWTFGFARKG